MNIMELGALGEFIGSIGVIATLIYLAVQIRQNTSSMDASRALAIAQAYQARAQLQNDAFLHMADSDHLGEIFLKYRESGLESLSPVERWRFENFMRASRIRLDNTRFQFAKGYIEPDFYDAMKQIVRIQAPIWKDLGLERFGMSSAFEAEVDRILAEEVDSG
jgi:uncharacterized membrane protein